MVIGVQIKNANNHKSQVGLNSICSDPRRFPALSICCCGMVIHVGVASFDRKAKRNSEVRGWSGVEFEERLRHKAESC